MSFESNIKNRAFIEDKLTTYVINGGQIVGAIGGVFLIAAVATLGIKDGYQSMVESAKAENAVSDPASIVSVGGPGFCYVSNSQKGLTDVRIGCSTSVRMRLTKKDLEFIDGWSTQRQNFANPRRDDGSSYAAAAGVIAASP